MTQQEINKLTWYDLPNKIKGFFTNILNTLTDLINRVINLEDNIPQTGVFSITEINTKSKWIDDKDIYRIVLEGVTGATTNIIDVNILNIDNMILMNGGLNDGDVFYPCFYTQEEENGDVVVTSLKYLISDKIIELRHYLILSGFKENIPGLSYKIIIEYTKTT